MNRGIQGDYRRGSLDSFHTLQMLLNMWYAGPARWGYSGFPRGSSIGSYSTTSGSVLPCSGLLVTQIPYGINRAVADNTDMLSSRNKNRPHEITGYIPKEMGSGIPSSHAPLDR